MIPRPVLFAEGKTRRNAQRTDSLLSDAPLTKSNFRTHAGEKLWYDKIYSKRRNAFLRQEAGGEGNGYGNKK